MLRKSQLQFVLILVAALMVATSALAQTASGRLIGRVVDNKEVALPGVTVTIQSEALIGGEQKELTDSNGEFSFIGLPPGMYTVRAEMSSFATQELPDVRVSLGSAAAISIQLPDASFGGEIEVTAESPVVDPTQVNTEQIFDQSYLKGAAIGSTNRSYQNILTQAAGVAGGSNPNVFGSSLGENAWYIDGIDTTDPVTATFTANFNFDAIQEIQFQTGGFEAEFGRATGGLVNLVTKSGGNRFSGTADVRYRDDSFQESGTHFDANELDSERTLASFTLGGPFVNDKLWFFASYQYSESLFTPIGGRSTDTREANLFMGKVTWQVDPAWRLVARWSDDPLDCDNCGTTRFVFPEAEDFQEQGGDLFGAELSAVLSDSLLWNTIVGISRRELNSFPQDGDLASFGHINDDTGEFYGNSINQQYSDRDRDEIATNLTWFVDKLAGSHEFKVGVEYSDMDFTSANCYTGTPDGGLCDFGNDGRYFEDIGSAADPIPLVMWMNREMGFTNDTGTLQTVYAQDAWRVAPNVTLKAGVRYDTVQYDNSAGEEVADMDKFQPRIGLAWDISGDAKNVFRASWGRFMHPSATTLPDYTDPGFFEAWLSCSTFLTGDPDLCAAFADAQGWGWEIDPVAFDPAGWLLLPANVLGAEGTFIDSSANAPFADEYILSFERALWDRTSIELTYVNKETEDVLEDTCSQNFPTPTEELNTECTSYTLGNLTAGRREYEGFIVKLESRHLDWLTLLASYTYSESEGDIEYTQTHNSDFDQFPFHFENRFGYLADDARHRVKLNGFFLLPYDFTIGFDAFYRSEFRWEPRADTGDDDIVPEVADMFYGEYFVEPRGSRTAGDDRWNLDLQVSKGFSVGGNVRIELIASVFNTFSDEYVTDVCDDVGGCGSAGALGDPIDWATPRRYEAGIRLEF
jgi:hypothetical protein